MSYNQIYQQFDTVLIFNKNLYNMQTLFPTEPAQAVAPARQVLAPSLIILAVSHSDWSKYYVANITRAKLEKIQGSYELINGKLDTSLKCFWMDFK